MSKITFKSNVDAVNAEMRWLVGNYLEEGSALIQSTATRLTAVDSGKTKGSWGHQVDNEKQEAQIGNSEENALWEEYGTGEYALEGDGRKGGWYVPPENLSPRYRKLFPEGMFTEGKKPKRMLHNAFVSNKARIKARAKEIMKGIER